MEKIQRRATKLVPHLRNQSYQSRLAETGLTTLEERRSRGDLIQFFKIYKNISLASLHGLDSIKTRSLTMGDGPASSVRRSSHRITKQLCTNRARSDFLTNRVADTWNQVPESVVINSVSLNDFKNKLNKLKE